MKERVWLGWIFILLGGLVSIGPQTFLAVCNMDEKVMKCHWTAQMELGLGIVIVILGVLTIGFKSPHIHIGLTIGIILNAILVILVPSVLIGVCKSSHMQCHALTLPALVILGGILILVGIAYLAYLYNKERK